MPSHFFISYTGSDLKWAEWIAWELQASGHKTTLAAWHFRPSMDFIEEMQKATTEADAILAVLSPEYFNASYTRREWTVGFVADNLHGRKRLVPVRVKECDLTGMWSSIIYIDLVNLTEAQSRRALLDGLRPPGPPTVRPIFPGPRAPFPGILPKVWNIPRNKNVNFKGREGFLDDLHKALTSKRGSALAQAIVGGAGVGKTELAVEYAYRHLGDYNVVWWLRSEALATDYGSLARAVPDMQFADQAAAVQSVREWFEQNENWLLIFDNAQNQAELRNYFPNGAGGHILITSRHQNWEGMANVLRVGSLELDVAASFLLPVPEAA